MALRPDGPGAEPVGKDRASFETIASKMSEEEGRGSEERDGGGFCTFIQHLFYHFP